MTSSTRFLPHLRRLSSVAQQPATAAAATSAPLSTVDAGEVIHFQQFAKNWWDTNGDMKLLHGMNRLRIPFVRDGLINTGIVTKENVDTPQPLVGVSILDVGCGGGILSEPLARLGGNVTGLDATKDLIEIARNHAIQDPTLKSLNYICTSIEEHAKQNEAKYDAIVASEIIEHVSNQDEFLKACVQCLKPKGSIFITTVNKTLPSYFGGIVMAEYVLRWLPKGTHQWEKFITPPQLQRLLEDSGCRTRVIHGMVYNFLNNTWIWSNINIINYALHAVKL